MEKLKIIVLGIVGRTPFAGVAWQAMHYLEGFRRLGHDVYYVEDTQTWCMDLAQGSVTADCDYTLGYIQKIMDWMDFQDRWAFRAISQGDRVFGMSDLRFRKVFEEADVLINLCASTHLRSLHRQVPIRVYLETDPGAPQLGLAAGHGATRRFLEDHNFHFTFAENIGNEDCLLPVSEFEYVTTRQPIVFDWWHAREAAPLMRDFVTTVASWKQSGRDITYEGETYTWSKHYRFKDYMDLPKATRRPCGMALACGDEAVIRELVSNGWQIVDALRLTSNIWNYRDFITQSRCEFTVAKDQYARTRSGWFSDRSASYLAAGRPVVTEDTRFDIALPVGEGLFAFQTREDVLQALDLIEADYDHHSQAASDIGREYFGAEKVLARFLEDLSSGAKARKPMPVGRPAEQRKHP